LFEQQGISKEGGAEGRYGGLVLKKKARIKGTFAPTGGASAGREGGLKRELTS